MARWGVLGVLAGTGAFGWLAWPAVPAETGPQRASSLYGYPHPDAPDCDERAAQRCARDLFGLIQGQSASWVAFRLHRANQIDFDTTYRGSRWSDTRHWPRAARAVGIAVDDAPALGAIAWYARGHVAYVERVKPRAVVISEMNHDGHNGFRTRTVTPGHDWPDAFLHPRDLQPSAAQEPPRPDRQVQTEDNILVIERDAERLLDAA